MAHPIFFATPEAFRSWLAANGHKKAELLVGFHKVGSALPSMAWPESVDEALCFGWIDGVRKRLDEDSYCIRFTPRKAGSIWSAINIRKVEALRAQGRLMPAGEAEYRQRSEGKSRVYAYEQPAAAELSAAEVRDFKRDKAAWKHFKQSPQSYRKVILHGVPTAKKAETRASRLATLVRACSAGERLR
jgi:uncharacterized protein YdeI (YjbR/CyaY-like superfamily)